MFNLNREEAVLLLGGVSSPILRKLKRRTILSFMPSCIIARYSPKAVKEPISLSIAIPASLNSMSSLGEVEDPGLSTVLAVITERRLHPVLKSLMPRLRRAAYTISVTCLAYSLLSSSVSFRQRRRRLNIAPLLWGLIVIYMLSLSYREFDDGQEGLVTRSKVRKILRFIQSQFIGEIESAVPVTPSTDVSSVRSPISSPRNSSAEISSIYWELSMCTVPAFRSAK